mmetsp:Transcript_6022/g.12615  ORF Transcript_6022/g.12615 Transcript_6022/m.12615 type:complete len:118 (+) Transcript_6022:628-981(+)
MGMMHVVISTMEEKDADTYSFAVEAAEIAREHNLNEDKGANTQQGNIPKEVACDVPRESKEINDSSQGGEGRNGLNAVEEDDALPSQNFNKCLSKARQKIKDQLRKKVDSIRKRDEA